jgi:hypothetical protein
VTTVGGEEVRAALRAASGVLARDPDGTTPVPATGNDAAAVAAHVTSCLTWYAHDLVAGPVATGGFELSRRPGADWGELRRQLAAAAEVLARAVDGAGPADRGVHDWGLADASGFAAMGCAELLLHAGDVADALGLTGWTPPADVSGPTLARLFPWAPADADPWAALRWATGRGDLPGRERVTSWRWHCAPLAEWDGTRPT